MSHSYRGLLNKGGSHPCSLLTANTMDIRIQTGRFRGQKVCVPGVTARGKSSRFTPGLIKEAFFGLLQSELGPLFTQGFSQISFFDLCAGSGQMGFEALSRGFGRVELVELDRKRISFLKKQDLAREANLKLHNKDCMRMGPAIAAACPAVAYLDPPYSFWNSNHCSHADRLLSGIFSSETAMNADVFRSDFRWLMAVQGPSAWKPEISPDKLKNDYCTNLYVRNYRGHYLTILQHFDGSDC